MSENELEVKNIVQEIIHSNDRKYKTLIEYGLAVLNSSSMEEKVRFSLEAYEFWTRGELPIITEEDLTKNLIKNTIPLVPARPKQLVETIPGNQKQGFIRLIHSLCHIESVAIDLSWDMLVRFAVKNNHKELMPKAFFDDWIKIVAEEARHYFMWETHLKKLGYVYGSFPIHIALWESAEETNYDIVARLCICHMVHEAHGLDVNWRHEKKLSVDQEALRLLNVIHIEEITHVAAGLKWYRYILNERGLTNDKDLHQEYKRLMKEHFRGELKPPFNIASRDSAGFPRDWYLIEEERKLSEEEGKLPENAEKLGETKEKDEKDISTQIPSFRANETSVNITKLLLIVPVIIAVIAISKRLFFVKN